MKSLIREEREEDRSLRHDRGGAVLLIGIFVALGLTGSLWFLIGIGDAIAFREMAQEATDAGTFSSAVVHARSMNFIAAVNLVMFGVTVIYLILAVIGDLFTIALATCVGPEYADCAYGTDGAVPAALTEMQQQFQQAAERYKNTVVQTTVKTGGQLEKIIAIGAPWAASFASNRVAAHYDKSLVASTLGLSNVPQLSGSGDSSGGATGGSSSSGGSGKRMGLPVKQVHASTLCDRALKMGLGDFSAKKSGQNYDFGFTPLKEAVAKAAKEITTAAHCSGDFWDEDAPSIVVSDAQNGSDYMQVYGFMIGARMKDRTQADRGVGALSGMKKGYSEKKPKANVYLSQAEFYFDCTTSWEASGCNKDDDAMYSPRWMVRLRRMRPPVAGSELGAVAVAVLAGGATVLAVQSVVGKMDGQAAVDAAKDAAMGQVKGAAANAASSAIRSNFGNVPGGAASAAAQSAAQGNMDAIKSAAKSAAEAEARKYADQAKQEVVGAAQEEARALADSLKDEATSAMGDQIKSFFNVGSLSSSLGLGELPDLSGLSGMTGGASGLSKLGGDYSKLPMPSYFH